MPLPLLITFFTYLLVAALVFSPFLLSVCMISLVVLSVFRLEIIEGQLHYEINGGFFWPWRLLRQYPAFGVLTFFFFIALLRAYPVEDFTYLVSRLRIKVPFLLLPIAFLYLPRFTAEDIRRLLYFLLAILTLTSLGILINYLLDFEAIN